MPRQQHKRAAPVSHSRAILVVMTFAIGLAGLAQACSVPVFRYALDHWSPDAYRIRILHDGPLVDDQTQFVDQLRQQAQARSANVVVEAIDIAQSEDAALADLYRQAGAQGQALCLVQAPTAVPDVYREVWSGPLAADAADALLASPVRQQLIQSLLAGTSVVWIYLEAGDESLDSTNYDRLTTELERLQGELKLPEIDPVDLKDLSGSPADLKLKFSALRLSRNDPAESLLVDMLLSTEPDLRDADYISQPMAFPVFGRGRVLYSLVGEGITAPLIEDACRFLTGACQCTVKAQNPGAELLLSADWGGLISPTAPTEIDVTLTGLAGFQSDVRPVPANAQSALATTADADETLTAVTDNAAEIVSIDAAVTPPSLPEQPPTTAIPAAVDRAATAITRSPDAEKSMLASPALIVSILGLIVIVGTFVLLPRR